MTETDKEQSTSLCESEENSTLKIKYLQAIAENEEKENNRIFQVFFAFRTKVKRMYRFDCMTRKINVNFYHFIKENSSTLGVDSTFISLFRSLIRHTSRKNFKDLYKKYPQFKRYYNSYLNSTTFKKLVHQTKTKYDDEYMRLFFRHSINFLNFYLKEVDLPKKKQSRFIKSKKMKNQ
jgi:hypothetical protein